jgi:hypothetical protein
MARVREESTLNSTSCVDLFANQSFEFIEKHTFFYFSANGFESEMAIFSPDGGIFASCSYPHVTHITRHLRSKRELRTSRYMPLLVDIYISEKIYVRIE